VLKGVVFIFNFLSKNDFLSFENEKVSLFSFKEHEVVFLYEKECPIMISIHESPFYLPSKYTIMVSGNYHHDDMKNEADQILEKTKDLILNSNSMRLDLLYNEKFVEFEENFKFFPVKIPYVTGLTMMECAVIYLHKNGFSYNEIGDMLRKKKKGIDNCMTRIKNKLNI
jgi:DNA-binding NarL/FixJ family response regulator